MGEHAVNESQGVASWNWTDLTPYCYDAAAGTGWRLPITDRLVKRLVINAGQDTPLHEHPDDHLLVVLDGEVAVHCGDCEHRLTKGSTMFIPAGTPHSVDWLARSEALEIGMGEG